MDVFIADLLYGCILNYNNVTYQEISVALVIFVWASPSTFLLIVYHIRREKGRGET